MFFLFDGSVTPTIGANGAGLGYSYNRTNSRTAYVDNNRRRGLLGAYLGVGFDYFGNYKGRRFQPDSRVNGVIFPASSEPGYGQSHITLRGAAGTTSNTSPIPGTQFGGNLATNGYGDNYFGYPVLVTAATASTSSDTKATLNVSTGSYVYGTGVSAISVRQGTSALPPSNSRKGIIELRPHKDGGFNVTVKLKEYDTVYTIIDKYHYPLSLVYTENANNDDLATGTLGTDTGNGAQDNTTHVLKATPPATLKMGFAASTGGAFQSHLIRSISVNLPFRAEPKDDALSVCVGETKIIDPFTNDNAYGGLITEPTYSQSNIDKNSFIFTDSNGNNLGTSVTTSKGTYTYDATTSKITFIASTTFTTGTDEVMYSIKGLVSPYNEELYRMPAKIVVTSYGVIPAPTLTVTSQPTSAVPNGSFTINNYNANTYAYQITPNTGVSVSNTGVVTAPAGTYSVMAINTTTGCSSVVSNITLNEATVNISISKTNNQHYIIDRVHLLIL